MLEFVIAFPVVITLVMGCMQFTHIWLGRLVVHYAAYAAARAALVCEESEWQAAGKQAAEQVCAWVVNGMTDAETDKVIPGWGEIPGSGGVARKVKVTISLVDKWNIKAEVEHDFALIMPIAGPMIGWLENPWDTGVEYLEQQEDTTGNIGNGDMVRYPHIKFTETVYMPKPYVTVPKMGIPGGW